MTTDDATTPPLRLDAPPGEAGTDSEAARRIRAAFEAACTEQKVHGKLTERDGGWAVSFEPQAGADGGTIAGAYRDELAAVGVVVEDSLRPARDMSPALIERACEAVQHGIERLAALMVQHNSYYRGGLPFPFPPSAPGFDAKGLGSYRYPSDAWADVELEPDAAVIRFAPGDLGVVTSCGFFVPVLVEGDFTITVDFVLRRWRPAPDDATCFGVLTSDDQVPERYHAQIMSTGDGPLYALAEMQGELSPVREISGDRGSLRMVRAGDTLTSLYRGEGGDWIELGRSAAPVSPVQILGAKVWGKKICGGIEVAVPRFELEGKISQREVPPPPVRPDPREAR